MELKDFIKDNKLIIPENEIDNVYVWHRVSMTQKVLLTSEVYHKMLKASFEREVLPKIQILKKKNPRLQKSDYQFSDFVTFFANQNKLFVGNYCFALTTNFDALFALACYICQVNNLYHVTFADMSELVMSYVDSQDKFEQIMSSSVLCLELYAPIPEHKWKSAILNSILAKRSSSGMFTIICTINKKFIIGDELMPEARLKTMNYIDITPICHALTTRHKQDYHSLMSLWYSMLKDTSNLVYSKEVPKERTKIISRYE